MYLLSFTTTGIKAANVAPISLRPTLSGTSKPVKRQSTAEEIAASEAAAAEPASAPAGSAVSAGIFDFMFKKPSEAAQSYSYEELMKPVGELPNVVSDQSVMMMALERIPWRSTTSLVRLHT